MSEIITHHSDSEKKPSELTIHQLSIAVRALGEIMPDKSELVAEAALRLEKLQNLNKLIGLLAPGGTAPRTALEQLWTQSDSDAKESQILLELRTMLESHWGEWTPAIREAEGLPPAE